MSPTRRSPIEQRMFTRVRDRFLVDIASVSTEEADRLAELIPSQRSFYGAGQAAPAPDDEDDELRVLLGHVLDRLTEMDTKLDHLQRAVDRIERGAPAPGSVGGLIEALALDVSGSGVAVLSPHPFEAGTRLSMVLNLPGNPTAHLRVLGRVVLLRAAAADEQKLGRYHLGIGFEAINEDDRQELIRYVFQRQRALLRSGHLESP
ncbi:MAG: PilZ domain-containing protein [Acidobacteriota bacterium]